MHPEDRARVEAALDAARRHASAFEIELRVCRADDGAERWLALYGRFQRDAADADDFAHQSIGVVFDITARKQAELELERRRVELQTMLELIPVGVAVAHDPRAEHITLSPRLAAMLRVAQGDHARRTAPYRCVRDGAELGADELPMRLAALTGRECATPSSTWCSTTARC